MTIEQKIFGVIGTIVIATIEIYLMYLEYNHITDLHTFRKGKVRAIVKA